MFNKNTLITIEKSKKSGLMLKTNGIMKHEEVCDILMSVLCVAIKHTAKYYGAPIEIYKQAVIKGIEKELEKDETPNQK